MALQLAFEIVIVTAHGDDDGGSFIISIIRANPDSARRLRFDSTGYHNKLFIPPLYGTCKLWRPLYSGNMSYFDQKKIAALRKNFATGAIQVRLCRSEVPTKGTSNYKQ